MQKKANPWSGKAKSTKSPGIFNEILVKHYSELEPTSSANPVLDLARNIKNHEPNLSVDEFQDIFSLPLKIEKIEQILVWLDKVEHQQSHSGMNQEMPIDSSYVHLPLHGYDTFHRLLHQSNKGSPQILSRSSIDQIEKQIQAMRLALSLGEILALNVI